MRISIKDLLSQIPDLSDIFCLVYRERPNVMLLKSGEHGYSIGDLEEYFDQYNQRIKGIEQYLDENRVRWNIFHWDTIFNINIDFDFQGMGLVRTLKELDLSLPSISGMEYFRIFPSIDLRPVILKEASIHYLLIFSYGMLARYQSSRWGKYIDPNLSNEAEMINKSIQVSKIRYLHLLVNFLFEEEFQFSNSIEKPEITLDKIYRDVKSRLDNDKRRGRF